MTNAVGANCQVSATTASRTAQAPDDYAALAGTVVSLAGVATTPLALSITDDILVEAGEEFTVTIALAAGSDPSCQLGTSVATITVVSDDIPSVVSIADATITEAGGGQALLSMTNPAGRVCTVTVTSTNGTAVAPADYPALSAAAVTLNGVGSVPLALSAVNDTVVESVESFTLTLALAPGVDPRCQLGDAVATVTIESDDIPPAVISIADATVTEGATVNQTSISVTNALGANCTVAVSTGNGTATAPGDFGAIAGGLFSVNGDPLTLSIVDDLNVEANESFTVNIALAAGSDPRCQIGDGQATITIVSNDVPSVISIADATVTEGAAFGETTITRTNPTGVSCNVAVTTANGSATAPGDYTAIAGATFSVNGDPLRFTIVDDLLVENSETFTVNIALIAGSDPRCQIGDGQATITIVSNDAATVVSIADATVTEGAALNQTTILRSNTAVACEVAVSTSNGTASAPGDYTAISGATFLVNGDALSLSITNDLNVEANETFTVNIALTAGADPRCQIGDGQATITIVSDDVASVISIADATVTEGATPYQTTVSRTNPSVTCNVSVTTSNGTAVAPGDYAAYAGATFTVNGDALPLSIVNDAVSEGPETFTVTLALVAGGDPRCQIGDGQATITIVSNE